MAELNNRLSVEKIIFQKSSKNRKNGWRSKIVPVLIEAGGLGTNWRFAHRRIGDYLGDIEKYSCAQGHKFWFFVVFPQIPTPPQEQPVSEFVFLGIKGKYIQLPFKIQNFDSKLFPEWQRVDYRRVCF